MAAWRADPGYTALQQFPGIGPVLAAVFVAEVGDVTRFKTAPQLACWAGLTPKHRESDTHVHRGRITKQGSRLVRWAAVESVQMLPGPHQGRCGYKNRSLTGVAGTSAPSPPPAHQVEFVFYALPDHHVRALHATPHGGRGRAWRGTLGRSRGRAGHDPRPTSRSRRGRRSD